MKLSIEQKAFIKRINPIFDITINSEQKDFLIGLLERTKDDLNKNKDIDDILIYNDIITDLLVILTEFKE